MFHFVCRFAGSQPPLNCLQKHFISLNFELSFFFLRNLISNLFYGQSLTFESKSAEVHCYRQSGRSWVDPFALSFLLLPSFLLSFLICHFSPPLSIGGRSRFDEIFSANRMSSLLVRFINVILTHIGLSFDLLFCFLGGGGGGLGMLPGGHRIKGTLSTRLPLGLAR